MAIGDDTMLALVIILLGLVMIVTGEIIGEWGKR